MMINKQFASRLLMLASTVFSLNFACTAGNARFCDSVGDCGAGQACVGGVCEVNLGVPDGAPLSPAAADATSSPSCGDENHACIANAPSGWSGPAIQVDQAPGTSAACPTDFDGAQVIGFEGLSASGSCGCSCGDTTDFTCQDAAVEGRDGPTSLQACFVDCVAGDCVRQTLGAGTCTAISSSVRSQDVLRLNGGVVTGGTCGAGTISDNLEEPSFETQVTLCVANLSSEGCEEGSACAATPPPLFDEGMCIFQEGEHACPSDSIYKQRRVIFAGYDDQRSCDTCDCTPRAIGDSCGSIEVFNDDPNCLGTPIDTNGICTAMPILVSGRVKLTRRTSMGCRATVDPPTSGAAVSVGATTMCCAL